MRKELDEILEGVAFFEGMGEEEIALIAGCGRNVRFDSGETIFRQGDDADVFYVVRQGSVAIGHFAPARGELVIETIEAGELLGWSWLFPPYRSHFDARAVTTVRATQFDGACLRGKCADDAALGYDLMSRFAQVLIERLQWTRLRLLDVYGDGR